MDTAALDEWVRPRGATKLYDAILVAANQLSACVERGESGVLIVMTDGADNDSEAGPAEVKTALNSLKRKNIQCILMAANVGDAQILGPTMGFESSTSITFTPISSRAAFNAVSASALRSVTGGSAAFTVAERAVSVRCR